MELRICPDYPRRGHRPWRPLRESSCCSIPFQVFPHLSRVVRRNLLGPANCRRQVHWARNGPKLAFHNRPAALLALTPAAAQALTRAADRGVHIRIYLDGTQLAEREPSKVFDDLAETPGVEIRTKHKPAAPMQVKRENH